MLLSVGVQNAIYMTDHLRGLRADSYPDCLLRLHLSSSFFNKRTNKQEKKIFQKCFYAEFVRQAFKKPETGKDTLYIVHKR